MKFDKGFLATRSRAQNDPKKLTSPKEVANYIRTVCKSKKLEDGNQQNSLRLNVFIFLKTCSHFFSLCSSRGAKSHIFAMS